MLVGDRYELVRRLGQGAFGVVWEATHRALTKRVAIKFMGAGAWQDAELALERFRYEAQVSARLAETTQHIVAVHDASLHGGTPYIVMDLVVGEALEARVARRPRSVDEVRIVMQHVGRALHAAHAADIVHRDVKPGNILCVEVAPGESIYKLTDFGVAKRFGDRPAAGYLPRATAAGLLVGTPAYMSPEQIAGEAHVDGSADVWALAVVAYECLTGRLPFDGNELTELVLAIVKGRCAPVSALMPGMPSGLDAFFVRAFAADRQDRFPTVGALVDGFEAASELRTAVSKPPPESDVEVEGRRLSGLVAPTPLPRRAPAWLLACWTFTVVSLVAAAAHQLSSFDQSSTQGDATAEPLDAHVERPGTGVDDAATEVLRDSAPNGARPAVASMSARADAHAAPPSTSRVPPTSSTVTAVAPSAATSASAARLGSARSLDPSEVY